MRRVFCVFVFLLPAVARGASPVRVNELAPEEVSPASDWVELYVASGPVDLAGWRLYEQNAAVKTFPSGFLPLPSGAYLLLHFNSSLPDEAEGDANENGWIDLHTPDPGLTGTSNVVSLRDPSGRIVDAVVYSDSASWTAAQQAAFDLAVSSGQWSGTPAGGALLNMGESVNLPGGVGAGNSIGRNSLSDDRDGRSRSREDWAHFRADQSPGRRNTQGADCPPGSGEFSGWITEAAPSLSAGGDFIEIYLPRAADLCGARIFEGGSAVKTFPSVTPGAGGFGAYVLFHAGVRRSAEDRDETGATGDLNGNGAVDVFSDEIPAGLAGSDNAISLRSASGAPIDFLAYADPDAAFDRALRDAYDSAAAQGRWLPGCPQKDAGCYIGHSVPWTGSQARSMARKASASGQPQDSEPLSAQNWTLSKPTPGWGYGTPAARLENLLTISQTPFSPRGGGPHSEARISYRAAADSRVTITIYDVDGRKLRGLLRQAAGEASGAGSVAWDGRDDGGRVVPIGIYWVQMDVERGDGSRESGSGTVVVAGRL